MTGVLVSIFALGALIVFHEAGHYFFAKQSGMNVRKFSIGFGPVLARFKAQGTEFQVALVPFGGFVQIDGLNPHDGTDLDAPGSYANKPFHLKSAVILGGPFANYLIGFLLLFFFYAISNQQVLPPIKVLGVSQASAAEEAGIRPDDLLLGTQASSFERVEDFVAAIQQSRGEPLIFVVEREGQRLEKEVTPQRRGDRFLMGVSFRGVNFVDKPLGWSGASAALLHVYDQSIGFLTMLGRLFSPEGRQGVEVSGPIGMVAGLSKVAEDSSLGFLVNVANISVILGLVNLLPIPALDGSRLLFLLVGLIRRREVEPKIEAWIHGVGFLLLLGLIALITISDVRGL